jgi:hypothetical protein
LLLSFGLAIFIVSITSATTPSSGAFRPRRTRRAPRAPKTWRPQIHNQQSFFLVLQNFGCKLQFGRFLVAKAATKL